MLHAATMTASHFHRTEVAMWQLHATRTNSNSLGFPIGEKKGFRKQRHGYGSSVDVGAVADLPQTFRGASANVVCPDTLFGLLARMVPMPKKTCS